MSKDNICYCNEDTNEDELKLMLLSRNQEWIERKDGSNSVNDSLKTVVLSCIDSRVQVERIFNAKPGELLVLKNAGNLITEDIIRSLLVAIFELKARFLIILAHTRCGMSILGKNEKIEHIKSELGHETLNKLQKMVKQEPLKWFGFFPEGKWEENVINQANFIKQTLSELIEKCDLPCIIPALYDLDTGKVTFLN